MSRSASRLPAVAGYVAMVFGGVVLFLLIRSFGEALPAPPASSVVSSPDPGGVASSHVLLHVLVALAAVIVTGRAAGIVLQAIGQPPVIGEVLGGIFLGPSLLGRIAPDASRFILPADVAPFLGVVAQLGVILYMFLVGLELNAGLLRRRAHAAVATSHASIVAPFVLGSVLALALYPRLSSAEVSFTGFALFMGVAMSVTAFPVLARILTDRGIAGTELGAIALTCAAVDDVTAWCLLAMVVGIVRAQPGNVMVVVALTAVFVAAMFLGAKPLVARLAGRAGERTSTSGELAVALVGVLLAALTTEAIGVHAVFGAFLFGAIIPHTSSLARTLTHELEDLVTIVMLPAFFAFTGMRTEIGLVSGLWEWILCAVIVLVATAGKFGGTFCAARLTGMGWRQSTGLGILMNTRGLMELIVLNAGLDLGVISSKLFAMMVIMALTTTIATTPVLQLLGISAARVRDPRRINRHAPRIKHDAAFAATR